jgi:hypothetical protein
MSTSCDSIPVCDGDADLVEGIGEIAVCHALIQHAIP